MKLSLNKPGKFALAFAGAIACFSLVAFFCTANPGSAWTAFADTPAATSAIPADSVALLESMQKANRGVASFILPSVVTLDVVETKTVQSTPTNPFPWFFFKDQGDGQGSGDGESQGGAAPSAPQREYKSEGLGSGIIVRKAGKTYYVLTNHHVAGSANEISVKMFDGREYVGKLVGGDERKDIALVSFESDDSSIRVARIGDSDGVETGDIVFAVGAPLGFMSSVTQGIVSAVGRDGGPNNNINDFIQTDAAINQGNSGGPLVNIRGEVIGVNSWIASSSGGSQGLGFSIPINNVKKAIDDFISGGKIRYGWLGVSLVDADKDFLAELGVKDTKGALAAQVFIGSPAEKSGLLPGDFVTALDGKSVKSVDQLVRDVGDLAAGQTAKFTVLRAGKTQAVSVKIEARDEKVVSDSSKLWPGFMPLALTDDIRGQLKLDAKQKGLVVTGVQARSAAAVMGLQNGDVVTKINDKDVSSLADFYKRLSDKGTGEVWFDVIRDGQTVATMRYKR